MTARKLPPRGDPCGLFFILGAPQPPPSKVGLAGSASPRKGEPPAPEKNGEGVSFAGGSPPLPGIGEPPCRAGGMLQRSLRIPRLERGIAGSASPRKGEPPAPRGKRGGCLIRRGQPAPAGDWGTALPGWGYAPEKFENSLLSKGGVRKCLSEGSRPLSRSKQGENVPFPEERYVLLQIGSYSAGLGKFRRSGGGI